MYISRSTAVIVVQNVIKIHRSVGNRCLNNVGDKAQRVQRAENKRHLRARFSLFDCHDPSSTNANPVRELILIPSELAAPTLDDAPEFASSPNMHDVIVRTHPVDVNVRAQHQIGNVRSQRPKGINRSQSRFIGTSGKTL